jgi:hypothetical protein
MPSPSVYRELKTLHDQLRPASRYQDLCISFEEPSGGTVWLAGGRWDHFERRWSVQEPEHALVIQLREPQVPFMRHFSRAHRNAVAGAERLYNLLLLIGGRRAGKTHAAFWAMFAATLDRPRIGDSDVITWLVSVSQPERQELDREIRERVPPDWYVYREHPLHQYELANGARLAHVSVDDGRGAEKLKRGRADLVLINEGAKMPRSVPFNAVGAIADRDGLMIITSNPPRQDKGAWVYETFDAWRKAKAQSSGPLELAEQLPLEVFEMDHKKNDAIDQAARRRVGKLMGLFDAAGAKADDDGVIAPVGDRAYYAFDELRHFKPAPERGDITQVITRQKLGREYLVLCGSDFQGRPHMAGVACRIFGEPERPVIWVMRNFIVDHGDEDDLIDTMEADGFEPERCLVIGDASGQWQDGPHTKGKDSFSVFRDRRWVIEPPTKKLSNKGNYSANPRPVALSVSRVNGLLDEDRLFVDPGAPLIATALKECRSKQGTFGAYPSGIYAHITDALRYVVWWVLPLRTGRRKAPQRQHVPTAAAPARRYMPR